MPAATAAAERSRPPAAEAPERADPGPGPHGEAPVELGTVVRIVAAAASLGAATVHASAISQHTFHPAHALAFVAMAAAQATWSYLVLRAASPRVLAGGAVLNGAILLLWLVTRTKGLPAWVPGPEGAEQIGAKDLAATLLATAVLAGIDLLSRTDLRSRLVRGTRAGAAVGGGLVLALVLTVGGTFAAGHSHDHPGPHPVPDHGH